MAELWSAFTEDVESKGRFKWLTLIGPILTLTALTVAKGFGIGALSYLVVWVMAAIGLGVGGIQLINSLCRPFWEHWEAVVGARGLLTLEGAVAVSLIGFGLYGLLGGEPSAWILAVGFCPAGVCYWFMEYAIAAKVVAAGKKPGRWHMSQLRPLRIFRSDAKLACGAEDARRTPQGGVIARALGPNTPEAPAIARAVLFDQAALPDSAAAVPSAGVAAPRVTLGEFRVWMCFVVLFVFLGCAAAAAGTALGNRLESYRRAQQIHERSLRKTKIAPKATKTAVVGKPTTAAPTSSTTTAATPAPAIKSDAEQYWSTYCPAPPGAGSPDWAETGLYDVYLGVNGFGAFEAGCTGKVFALGDSFVYQEGHDWNTGALKSIAVVSKDLPAAIFVLPAAPIVLGLIRKYGPLGGSQRYDVLNGDVQLAYVSAGTICLVRPQKFRSGTSLPEPLRVLEPAVCAAWYTTMTEQQHWLWIDRTSIAPNGVETYTLMRSAIKKTKAGEIRFDPSNGEAFRNVGQGWISSYAAGERISESAVSALTATAAY